LEQRNIALSSVVAAKAHELSLPAAASASASAPATPASAPGAPATAPAPTTSTTTATATALAETGRHTYYVRVRTSVKASAANNGQAAINAGGQVAVIWKGVGTIVSAHNYVDSRALKLRAGDVIRFSGVIKGVYRVVNAVKLSKGSPVSSVKKLGMTMMMQTCYFGTGMMRIVGLKLVR
jgi:hypothetical protein